MARYKLKTKRLIVADPFYDSILIQKITNKLIKKGKKTLAHKIMNKSIQEIEKNHKMTLFKLLNKQFITLLHLLK